jgi:hypothetical protein
MVQAEVVALAAASVFCVGHVVAYPATIMASAGDGMPSGLSGGRL